MSVVAEDVSAAQERPAGREDQADWVVKRLTINGDGEEYRLGEALDHTDGVWWREKAEIHFPAKNAIGNNVTLTHDGTAFVLANPASGPANPLPATVLVSWLKPPRIDGLS